LQKLTLWLLGQSARHLAANQGRHDEDGGGEEFHLGEHMAVADIAARRYMPSRTELVADINGTALWEEPTEMRRESPLVSVNTAVLKMGLPPEKNTLEGMTSYSNRKKVFIPCRCFYSRAPMLAKFFFLLNSQVHALLVSTNSQGPSEEELKKAQERELKNKADDGRKGKSVFSRQGAKQRR
jgi:hypothetical protein